MTSKPKVYQNYRFDELIAFTQHNPHRTRRLTPIEIFEKGGEWSRSEKGTKDTKDTNATKVTKATKETTLSGFGLNGYTVFDLQPSGLLSLMVCMEDPHTYAISTPAIRSQQNIEYCTRLQERTDELKQGPLMRKRKRIYELLGMIYNESHLTKEEDYNDLFRAMEVFQDAHFVLMNRAVQDTMETDSKGEQNTIRFSSSPLLWKRDRPVWLVDALGRWMAVPTDTDLPLASELADWLLLMTEKGWVVKWPEAEGNKTEIVEQLTTLGKWEESDKKFTKDILAERLGKEKSLHLFRTWNNHKPKHIV